MHSVNKELGYIISISGENLELYDFFKKSAIQPDVIDKIDNKVVIQFCDLKRESYPLDMLSEVLEFIAFHSEEFKCLLSFSGIEEKIIRLFDSTEASGGFFLLNNEGIKILHEFGFDLEITVV